jgi:nucleolar protein 9
MLTRLERSRVAVLKTLIDACAKHSVPATPIVSAITDSFSCSSQELIFKMLHLKPEDLLPPPETAGPAGKPKRDPNQLHGSLLAQTFLALSAEASAPICDSILSQPQDTIVGLCKHPQASHVVQKLFNSPTATIPNKRKLLNILKGRFVELSLDTIASHIVDTCWDSPMNYRQSIAEELLHGEAQMRESYSGRAVWRNWSMDKYKTQRQFWFKIGKEEAAVAAASQGKGAEKKKTAIELARERHAAQKARGFGTGANSRGKRSAADMGGEGEKKKPRVE